MNNAIIFDMGNVLLPFDHMKPCRLLSKTSGLPAERIYQLIFDSGLEAKFESGAINGNQFIEECEFLLRVELDKEEFKLIWSDIFTENLSVTRIVEQLKPVTKLILLSNTNQWHFEHVKSKFSVIANFEECVLSFRIGVMKPHPKIFEKAIELTTGNDRVFFIDDMSNYVKVARTMGMEGHVYKQASDLQRFLGERGLL